MSISIGGVYLKGYSRSLRFFYFVLCFLSGDRADFLCFSVSDCLLFLWQAHILVFSFLLIFFRLYFKRSDIGNKLEAIMFGTISNISGTQSCSVACVLYNRAGVGFVLLDLSSPNIHTLQKLSLLIGLELGVKLYHTTLLRNAFWTVEGNPTRQKAGGNTKHDAKANVS